jgi:nucleoid DNA-binding protein
MAQKAAPNAARPRLTSKGEILAALAEKTGIGKKQVAGVFAVLGEELKKGPGQFVIPGLLKLKVVRKPATRTKPGRNPFTGEPMTIKARPARNVVRAVPMKALYEMV